MIGFHKIASAFILSHPRFALAFDDFADDPGLVLLRVDEFQHRFRLVRRDDAHHADAHVEDLIQFLIRHAALGFDDFENRQHVPRTFLDDHVERLGQHARDVVHKTAAGDVREGLDRRTGVAPVSNFFS